MKVDLGRVVKYLSLTGFFLYVLQIVVILITKEIPFYSTVLDKGLLAFVLFYKFYYEN